jgi:hypothetical protein
MSLMCLCCWLCRTAKTIGPNTNLSVHILDPQPQTIRLPVFSRRWMVHLHVCRTNGILLLTQDSGRGGGLHSSRDQNRIIEYNHIQKHDASMYQNDAIHTARADPRCRG